jgi:hypothetical protein
MLLIRALLPAVLCASSRAHAALPSLSLTRRLLLLGFILR